MLRIGTRQYEVVRSQGGFSVMLGPNSLYDAPQTWQLCMHYIPGDHNPVEPVYREREYLELSVQPLRYEIPNWRALTSFGRGRDKYGWESFNALGNLLDGGYSCKRLDVRLFELTVKPAGEYLFACHLEGVLVQDGVETDMELDDTFAFENVNVPVPVNAADTLATARRIAARELKLTEVAGSHMTRNDWRRKENVPGPVEASHSVTLLTPWRDYLA